VTAPWPELARFRAAHAPGTMGRLRFDITWSTSMRSSDAVRVGRENLREHDGVLCWDYFEKKNRKRKPNHIIKPIDPELLTLIKATPGAWGIGGAPFGRRNKASGINRSADPAIAQNRGRRSNRPTRWDDAYF
jgi:hypothetical protein